MRSDSDLYGSLLSARSRFLFEHAFVSNGYPKIDGFRLVIEPPWRDFTPDECLQVSLTSAAVLPVVVYEDGFGAMLVRVIDSVNPNRWEIPSGGVEEYDKDIIDTGLRELGEETGLRVGREELIPVTYARHGDVGGLQFMTLVEMDLDGYERDEHGRFFLRPLPGSLAEEVDMLVVEPLSVFFDPMASYLKYSEHPWATVGLREAIRTKLEWASQG
jgi:8-oxo-dGTP pyrophosphatase MutT (NUDIX family)